MEKKIKPTRRVDWPLFMVVTGGVLALFLVYWARRAPGPETSAAAPKTSQEEVGIEEPRFEKNGSPSWSPDGSQIVFYSNRHGNDEIYVMNADGSDVTRLTTSPASEGYPVFSPDGSKISFDTDRDGNFEVYVVNADGSSPTRLTDHPLNDVAASWSPDGSEIAFMSYRNEAFEVRVMNADGSNQHGLTASGWFPVFSPDGSKIAYNDHNQIFVIDATGTDPSPRRLAESASLASWSPDGARIAFQSRRDGNQNVYLMNADGSDPTRITDVGAGDLVDPRWSPDGSKFVYVHLPNGMRDGPSILYVMDADGSNQIQLTNLQESARKLSC